MWPWPKHRPADTTEDLEAAAAMAAELEDRAQRVESVVRRVDPWAAAILDTLKRRGGRHAG